jgi:hypothetical protein
MDASIGGWWGGGKREELLSKKIMSKYRSDREKSGKNTRLTKKTFAAVFALLGARQSKNKYEIGDVLALVFFTCCISTL